MNVNTGQSTFANERERKLNPTKINGKDVYYFDLGSSAGYDHDELSRTDFVYVKNNRLHVTNLPAFYFGRDNKTLVVYPDKNSHTRNKTVISI